MNLNDELLLLHPLLAIVLVFPTLGIVLRMALQTRQRRLKIKMGEKSSIPANVGRKHVDIGRWLSGFDNLHYSILAGETALVLPHPQLIKCAQSRSPVNISFDTFRL